MVDCFVDFGQKASVFIALWVAVVAGLESVEVNSFRVLVNGVKITRFRKLYFFAQLVCPFNFLNFDSPHQIYRFLGSIIDNSFWQIQEMLLDNRKL